MGTEELEVLLNSLYKEDDGEDEIAVIAFPFPHGPSIQFACCVYSYSGYSS